MSKDVTAQKVTVLKITVSVDNLVFSVLSSANVQIAKMVILIDE